MVDYSLVQYGWNLCSMWTDAFAVPGGYDKIRVPVRSYGLLGNPSF